MISPGCDFEMISDKISPIVKVAVTVNKRYVQKFYTINAPIRRQQVAYQSMRIITCCTALVMVEIISNCFV